MKFYIGVLNAMENITNRFVFQVLTDMGYTVNENGLFQIKKSISPDEIAWEMVLNGEQYPIFAFNQCLDEIKMTRHKIWAEGIAYQVISTHLGAENNRDELVKQFILLVMQSSELIINTDDLFGKSIMVNIGVDTGDSNMDYTANTVPPAHDADHSLQESEWCASIVWLTKQQGHKKGELYFALDHIKHSPELIYTKLMASIANEVWHTLSIFTQLFFFVRMSVYDLLLMNSLLQWHHKTGKWGGYILLNRETSTGFYSTSVGSSSLAGIQLEKEVKLPVKYISEILPDSAYKYPMSKICKSTVLWEDGKITYMSLPKLFRMSMEEYGFSPLKKNIKRNIDNI